MGLTVYPLEVVQLGQDLCVLPSLPDAHGDEDMVRMAFKVSHLVLTIYELNIGGSLPVVFHRLMCLAGV